MKVRDIMTRKVLTCEPGDTLARAGGLMWNGDCGVLPVVRDGQVVGMLTDRDICMALVMNGYQAVEMAVSQVMSGGVHACSPGDDVAEAVETMREHQVRRLPVIADDGALEGVLSLTDVALVARAGRGEDGAPTYREFVGAIQAVCSRGKTKAA
jgi:CBS domain-containing protein